MCLQYFFGVHHIRTAIHHFNIKIGKMGPWINWDHTVCTVFVANDAEVDIANILIQDRQMAYNAKND
jgi:hypothetical protein